jgi:hypothetical protein
MTTKEAVMPQVSETIPEALTPRVDAAVSWFNASAEAAEDEFKVTGILDADEALRGSKELRLILCGGGRCEQRSFRVGGTVDAWEVEFADPPPGPRLRWLDEKLSQHAFVVLLFYRGFW